MEMESLSIVTYCMGRILQAREFVPHLLALLPARAELVLVDFSDPMKCGPWFAAEGHKKLTVVRVEGCEYFHVDHARNLGGRAARGEALVFADIDFLFSPEVIAEIQTLKRGEYLIQHPRVHSFGFMVCWRSDYLDANGYEEAVAGYGCDDTQFMQILTSRGLGRRVMQSTLTPLLMGDHCRILGDQNLGHQAAVNQRILRALRGRDSRRNNVHRNWGWGGKLLCVSDLGKETRDDSDTAGTGGGNGGADGLHSHDSPGLYGAGGGVVCGGSGAVVPAARKARHLR